MNRRDVLIGGGLIAAAAAAAALQPRNHLVLLPEGRDLEDVIPQTIGSWHKVESEAFVLPKVPGSLSDRLYNQTISRLYLSESHQPIMVVIAYGAVQNDLLQLHRPEVCYAAVGFTISESRTVGVALNEAATLPVRELTARSQSRVEPILYWTRIGDDLPTSGPEQRRVKLRQQMDGYLADGVLIRLSTIGEPTADTSAELALFARSMVMALKPEDRPALVGRPLAALLK